MPSKRTMEVTKESLRKYFVGKHKAGVIPNTPPYDYYDIMLKYIEKKNFLQILNGMGVLYLLVLLDFYEENEQFETCAEIRDTIGNYNIVSGENLNTKLEC